MTRRSLLWVLLAVLCAVLLGSVAPDPWPDGPATLSVRTEQGAFEVPLELGGPVVVHADVWDVRIDPSGPVFEVELTQGVAATLGQAVLHLELADGRRELIPVVTAEGASLSAERRAPVHSVLVLGLLGIVVVFWLSETLPLWVTSLCVPVVLVAGGATGAAAALAPFFHPVIALFFAGFALADALATSGLDRRVALAVVSRAGSSPVVLYCAMLGMSAVLSMFMSNTAAAAILIPVAIAVTRPLGESGRGYRHAMVLGIAYAATLGGVGSAIGTPANPIAIAFLASAGHEIGFLAWFAYGLPMVGLFLPVVGAWVWWRLGASAPRELFDQAVVEARAQHATLPAFSSAEKLVAVVFVMVVLGWLSDRWHGLHPGLVGLAGVVMLNALGRFDREGLSRIDWSSLLTFGGGLTLGVHLTETGTSAWIATRLEVFGSLPGTVGVMAVATLALLLTAVASNTASAAILIPLSVPLAAVLGLDPSLLVMVVAVASSIDFALVIGTPPTMVAYSTGYFTAGQIFRTGVVLDVLGLLVLVLGVVTAWRAMGLVP